MTTLLQANLIGHGEIAGQLTSLIERNSVPHALMFCGPSGVGKRTAARAFAADLLARARDATQEGTWNLVRAGNHPDLHFVAKEADKKELPVEAIRSLCQKLQLKPYLGGCSVAIIDQAEEMSLAASNALLMTLEEPTSAGYLILVTDAPNRLPETIISRCQLLYFKELKNEEISRILHGLLPRLPENDLAKLLTLTQGSLSPLGLSPYLDPQTFAVVKEKEVLEHLSRLSEEMARLNGQFDRLLTARRSGEAVALSLAAELASERETLPLVWSVLRNRLREKLRSATGDETAAYGELLAAAIEAEQRSKERTLNPQLQFSSLFLKITDVAAGRYSAQ